MKQLGIDGPPPPVAAIVQQQRQEWTGVVGTIAKLAVTDDQNALRMGDILAGIEREYTPQHVKLAAEQAGVTWSVARQRLWVSKRIPKGSPLRALPLSFCHLRALAAAQEPEAWAEKVISHSWSVATLRDEMARAGDREAQLTGQPCIQCETPLTEAHEVIAFSIGRGKRARLCSRRCARDYFIELVKEEDTHEGGE